MEINIGEPYYVTKFSGRKRRKVLTQDSLVYIPIRKTLLSLLKNADIRSSISHTATECKQSTGILRDVCDGLLYKKHPILSSSHKKIQITAYYDEIELCNPLGSYTKVHKLGCLFSIGNIPARFRSQLKTMYLVTLATAPVISKHGIDKIVAPFVEELRSLHNDKLEVSIGNTCEKYEVALLALLADNLAAHQIGGFKESMSFAHRICRSCMTTTEKAQKYFLESNFELRTPEMHTTQCANLESEPSSHLSKEYGINRKSILENIPNFSVVQNLPHDIMHDLIEGVIPYEMKSMLSHFVNSCHYFTLQQRNERLQNYDFGYSEISDKPSSIHDLKPDTSSLRQSASQMWLLSIILPLLVGDFIPECSEHWHCFLFLLKICSIAAAWTISKSSIEYLSLLIEEHHELFKKLYPEKIIIPKMHYMFHYPSQIRNFGPLVYSWTMRYESKLRILKCASRHGNFKNICKTVAKKHQHLLCYYLNNGKSFLQKDIEVGPTDSITNMSSCTEFHKINILLKILK